MTSSRWRCVICGVSVPYPGASPDSWLRQFRVVYSDSGAVYHTGTGLYIRDRSSPWQAPSDESKSWDDPNCNFLSSDTIPLMPGPPENGMHGFVLHDACWRLLKQMFDAETFPLERFYNVCDSLPSPLFWDGFCWDHDYGGLALLNKQGHYSSDNPLVENPIYASRLIKQPTNVHAYAQANPYDIPGISELMDTPSKFRQQIISVSQVNDCFAIFPWEILEAVAVLLPTSDALNLRLASKSFFPISESQYFWSSKFAFGRERDFLFEARRVKACKDWKFLYQHTGGARATPGLWNRRRIWNLIKPIKEYLQLCKDDSQKNLSEHTDTAGLHWTRVEADFRPGIHSIRFVEGGLSFEKTCAFVPKFLSEIAFSIIGAGEADYVVGLRLIGVDGDDDQLGYRAEGRELFFKVTTLRGFKVAVGPRGIRAIQIIYDDHTRSEWAGCPTNVPVTERLVRNNRVAAIEVGFDGYKLVTIAVAEAAMPTVQALEKQELSRRSNALWYPDIPEVGLYLNDASFIGEPRSAAAAYSPLACVLFGGSRGSCLRYLTQVSVASGNGKLYGIEFHYEDGESLGKNMKLGLDNLTADMQFSIDGRGGENITGLEISVEGTDRPGIYIFGKNGKLRSFKITTNRGRSFHFDPKEGAIIKAKLKELSIVPGTTIVGLFASQHHALGLINLGAISAEV